MVRFKEGLTPTSAPTSAAMLAPTNAPSQCLQFEVELVDTDMSGDLLEQRPADTSDECCGLCEEVDGCEGFAHAGRTCYLKRNFLGTFPAHGVVTRIKADLGAGCPGFDSSEQGKDLIGDLIESWAAPSSEACCASCARKSFCQGFAYFEGWCSLKKNVRGTYAKEGCMVRFKEGHTPTPAPTSAPTLAPCEASCECFVERDPNFCNTCPACGP